MKTISSMTALAATLLACGLTQRAVFAQAEPVKLTLKGAWPGYTRGPALQVAVVSNLAYVALNSAGLAIFDVSQPDNPVRVGGYKAKTNGYARAVQVVSNYAYVAAWTGGLRVIDVSDPSHPTEVGRSDTGGWAQYLRVVGRYAYVSWSRPIFASDDYAEGLDIFDVSNPVHPVRVASRAFTEDTLAGEIQVVNNYAYVAGATFDGTRAIGGLSILDVSNPASPVWVGGFVATQHVNGVQISGDYVYLAAGDLGLVVIDARNPAAPASVGSYDTAYAFAVQVSGNYAYVCAGSRLQVIDISNPAKPLGIGSYDTGESAWNVFLSGSYAYVADLDGGLQVIDVSNPSNPFRVGGYNTTGTAWHVEVAGNYGYVADDDAGLQVIDVSDPANPSRVGGYRTNLTARTVRVAGNYAFVLGSRWTGSNNVADLEILDLSNPPDLVRVGGYVSDAFAEGLDVAGNFAYVAGFGRWTSSNYFGGLKIIDVSNPANPVLISSSLGGASDAIGRAIRVAGNYAYVGGAGAWTGSNYFGALQIIDVSDRSNPVLVGRASTSGPVGWGVDVAGNYAYLANEQAGLEVIDVSRPGDPVRVGGIRTGYAFDVSVAGNYAYLVGGPPALQVIDVSNPADPLRVGSYDNGETGRGVQVVGNRAYVANGTAGLTVLEITVLPYFRSIARTGDKLAFSWNGLPGRILQRAGSFANPDWSDVPGTDGQSHFECPLSSGHEFFRLVER